MGASGADDEQANHGRREKTNKQTNNKAAGSTAKSVELGAGLLMDTGHVVL